MRLLASITFKISVFCKFYNILEISALEGNAERLETEPPSEESPETDMYVRSSPHMPVPEYLEKRTNDVLVQGQRQGDWSEDEVLPPSYEEAVKDEGEQQPEPIETDPIIEPVGGAEGTGKILLGY